MSDPAGTKFDGDFLTPTQSGPVVPFINNETQSLLYRVPMCVRSIAWKPTVRGTIIPGVPGVVVEETEPHVVGADVVEWEILCAVLPPSRTIPEPYVFNYQFHPDGDDSHPFSEVAVPVTSYVTYDYFDTATPEEIPILLSWRELDVNGTIFHIGTKPPVSALGSQFESSNAEVIAEDSGLNRWKGDMWVRDTRRVRLKQIRQNLTT